MKLPGPFVNDSTVALLRRDSGATIAHVIAEADPDGGTQAQRWVMYRGDVSPGADDGGCVVFREPREPAPHATIAAWDDAARAGALGEAVISYVRAACRCHAYDPGLAVEALFQGAPPPPRAWWPELGLSAPPEHPRPIDLRYLMRRDGETVGVIYTTQKYPGADAAHQWSEDYWLLLPGWAAGGGPRDVEITGETGSLATFVAEMREQWRPGAAFAATTCMYTAIRSA